MDRKLAKLVDEAVQRRFDDEIVKKLRAKRLGAAVQREQPQPEAQEEQLDADTLASLLADGDGAAA